MTAWREGIRAALAAHSPVELPLEGRRPAAVMLVVYEHEGRDCIPFQLRTDRVRYHRGEISLPGGRADDTDGSLLATALRETHEEIGIPPEHIEVFGRLDDQWTRGSAFRITPFVGAVAPGAGVRAFARAPHEVREMLYVPLDHLASDEARAWKVVDEDGEPVATPAYRFGEHLIWGATARVVGSFLDVLRAAGTAPLR